MSKQFAFALCVTTILGGTESVYAETPKLLEEGRDGKHILVKKKKGKPFSFKRNRQTAAIETGKVTPQGRKRSKKTFSFKRKSLNRAHHIAALETGKANLLGRKKTRKPFSFFFKRKHQAVAAEAAKINLQVRKKSKKLFSFKRNRQALAAETGKVNFQMRKKPRKFFFFARKSLNKRPQIAPIPLVSSIRPVRNGHLVLKSLTSKAPLNQYREERKVIRAHPSVQNIIFFPRTERDTLAVKQILRNKPTISQVETPAVEVRASNNEVENEIVLQPAVSELVAAHVVTPTTGGSSSHEVAENEDGGQAADSEPVSALAAIHAEGLRNSLDPVENGDSKAFEQVDVHAAAHGEGDNVLNEPVEDEMELPAVSELVAAHVVTPTIEGSSSHEVAVNEDGQAAVSDAVSALAAIHAEGLRNSLDPVENGDSQAFEQVDALDSELNEVVSPTISDAVITQTDVSGEEVSAGHDSVENETVLSELSNLFSTQVVEPMKEALGLSSSNDAAAHEEEQPISELVSAHTVPKVQEAAPAIHADENAVIEPVAEQDPVEVLPVEGNGAVIEPVAEEDPVEVLPVEANGAVINPVAEENPAEILPVETNGAVIELVAEEDPVEVLPVEANGAIIEPVADKEAAPVLHAEENAVIEPVAEEDPVEVLPVEANGAVIEPVAEEDPVEVLSVEANGAVIEPVAEEDPVEVLPVEANGAIIDSIVEQDLTPANNGGGEAGAEVEPVTTPENEDSPNKEIAGDATATGDDQEFKEVDIPTTTLTGEGNAFDDEEELGLSSIFTDHAEDLEDKNLQTTTDGLSFSSERPIDTSLDDDLLSLYGNDEEPVHFRSHEDSLSQLSSLLSGKEPTPSASNSFLQESEDLTPNSDLLAIQEEIGKITLNAQTLYHQMSADEFETESKKLQDSQRKAVDLAINLSDLEDQVDGDESLLNQITQVRELLQNKAQQLLDLQARVDYVSKKRKEEEKPTSDQIEESSGDTSISPVSVSQMNNVLSTSLDRSNGFSITADYSMRDMSPQESFYQLSSLLSGKTSEPSYGSLILQQEESNPILFDIQEKIRDIHPNVGVLYHQMSPSEFEAERLQLESLQGKAANLVVMLNEVEEQERESESESGNGSLLEQISYVKKTLQDKAQQLLDLQRRVDHVSKQREDGEKRRLEEQNLSFGQIEGSMGETGTDEMTNQHPEIPSDALPLLETATDESTSSSIPTPSVSSEQSSKFGEFSTHLTALTSLLGASSDKLGTLEDSQKASTKGILTPRLVKLLQNNLHDQAQTLGLQTSFEKFEEERELSYDEALSALPQLLQFASSIQADTLINLNTPTTYVRLLNNFLSNFVKSLSGDQAQ